MKFELQNDDYSPLREVVFKTIRQAIIEGKFQPGERLMEVSLANKLGVSRTPVREAMRMLELEGLVVMIPRRGAEVARITVKDLRDTLEVRLAMESLSVRLACERIDDEGRDKLKKASVKFKEAVKSKKVSAIVESDEEFHNVIYACSKNKRLINITQNLREQVYRYRLEYVRDFSYHDNLIKEHDLITMAILDGDAVTAEKIMNEHIYNQEQIVIRNVINAE